ncbi:amidohydrolase family protein [Dactylosporangium sp. CA-092794]|uniref:amidohydrolase family protein n=1 Tax=Dactylosporangium sp. CA-092794 TaxID=3239929 RepID=UPI003D948EC9
MNLLDTHTHVSPGATSAEALLAGMDAAGVGRALLVQAFGRHGYDNSYVLSAAAAHPGRFAAVGVVDPRRDAVASAADLLTRGALGVRVYAIAPEHDWNGPIWDFLDRERVPTAVTVLPRDLPAVAAIAAAYPRLPLAVDGCGFTDATDERLRAAAALRNVSVKLTAWNIDRDADVTPMVELFGPGRVMWGSNFGDPADRRYPELAAMGRSACAGPFEAALLGGTAERFWWSR